MQLDATNDAAQFWLGGALLLTGENASAIPPLEEAVRLAPASREYKRYLLFAYIRGGVQDKALALQSELMRKP